ncbi:MAG: heavy metal translocating P-type ATPase [Candidatus Hydrogenedentes bacterium]|nr:heavy metal translocating P-type ATPase [Candidatus Hydrogenedentota bacterium]
MSKIALKIRGMDCAEEIAIIKRALAGQLPESSLSFDLMNGRLFVEAGGEEVPAIIAAINGTGMRAIPWADHVARQQAGDSFWEAHGRSLSAAASGLLITAGYLAHAAQAGPLAALAGGGDEGGYPVFSIAAFVFAIATGGWFIFPKAVYAARAMRPDMNLLMVTAVIGAGILGEWFEAATVTFLFALALLLESWSVGRARRAIGALMDMAPATARYICPHDGDIETKPVADVPPGVTVLVRPGERIPLDGTVTRGETTVNQAPITGESVPVSKGPGDTVYAGTINEDGAIEFRSTGAAEDTTLARIVRMVEEAQQRRARSEQWVETFARYYTPIMMALAIAVAVLPPLTFGGDWSAWFYQALVLLVIACPCALVISTPVSIVAGLNTAARAGVLVKGGVFLEAPSRIRAIALDKTGTLTRGRPEVQRIVPLNGHTEKEVLERAAALEQGSEHPLARAVLARAHAAGVAPPAATGFQALRGRGAEAQINGRDFWIGSHQLLHEKGAETPGIHDAALAMEDAGHSVIALGNDDHVCGLISVGDAVRPDAAEAVRAMKDAGIDHVVMLTGDNRGTAQAIAELAGVDDFRAELLPEEKVAAVRDLVARYGQVAMVGDGVNDAPAMAEANLGIAMGAMGTDVAIETADIALMADDLEKIAWLVRHSRRTLAVIKQNIAFALGLKLLFVLLAMGGWATLWMAIAADMGASLLVIFNGLRLLRDPAATSS